MKIVFTGDVCFKAQHDIDREKAKSILSEVRHIFDSADYVVMNLETPLAPEGVGEPIKKSGPNIIGRPQNIGFLEEADCSLAVLANNHTGDFGDSALYYTLDLLNEHKIAHVGAGKNIAEAYEAHRTQICGRSFSFIGVNENEFGTADENKAGTAGFDLERIGCKLAQEREVSEYVIVIFHGGNEHNPLPSPMCRSRYRTLIRLGADAVIGGHTHCIQGFEYYNGKPIVYSMGNFFFKPTNDYKDRWYTGYITELSVENGVLAVEPIPYRFEKDGSFIHELKGEEHDKIIAYIKKLSDYIPDTKAIERLYKGWCTKSGISYISGLQSKSEYYVPENTPADIAPLRNLLSCEAHNELCRMTLQLAFTGELREAFEYRKELDELSELPV